MQLTGREVRRRESQGPQSRGKHDPKTLNGCFQLKVKKNNEGDIITLVTKVKQDAGIYVHQWMTEYRNSIADTDNGAIRNKFMFIEGKWMEIERPSD